MPVQSRKQRNHLSLYLLSAGFLVLGSCGKSTSPAAKVEAPAKIENAVKESTLTKITLSAEAEKRLGIEIAAVENRILPGTYELGGEIIAVPGSQVRVSAPFAGKVLKNESGAFPSAGRYLKKGEPILRLLLLPPDKDILGAREDVAIKEEELKVAQARADRSGKLLIDRAVSEKSHEETMVALMRAKAVLDAAKSRLALLGAADPAQAAAYLSILVLDSPVAGVLQSLFVSPEQIVPASAVLFEVASLRPAWVRVPVYVGDLAKIDFRKEAAVRLLGSDRTQVSIAATPVQGPPLSDAASASADIFYQITNRDGLLRIGQKVRVSLLKIASEDSLAVPASALLYDMDGGSWVYVKTSSRVYARKRVEVSHFVGRFAILARGVASGDLVVTAGAAELFGTEFGVGK